LFWLFLLHYLRTRTDEVQVHLPFVLDCSPSFLPHRANRWFSEKGPPPLHSVDLNTANEKQLEQLPGVGPTTAKAIVEFRTKSGRFRRIEDLLVIRGISESKLEKIRPYVIVGPSPKKPPQ
jgi:competence ComEA-like helix-hairpin-helix protein